MSDLKQREYVGDEGDKSTWYNCHISSSNNVIKYGSGIREV